MDKPLLQSLIAALISLVFGVLVYRLAKSEKLNFRYAVGWLSLSFIGLFSGFLSLLITPLAEFLGITPTAVIGIGALVLFMALSIQLSVSISGIQKQTRKLAETVAYLENKTIAASCLTDEHEKLTTENVLIVVPAFNEEQNIEYVLREMIRENLRVLVIDDGSHDKTAEISRGLGIATLVLPFNLGVGGALRAGFQYAVKESFDAVIQVDADGQHDVAGIRSLIHAANESGSHLVLGSRFTSGTTSMHVSPLRRAVMKFLANSASRATQTKITDATSGYRLIRNPLLLQFSINFPAHYLGDTYEALVTAGRSHYLIEEIPTKMENRMTGESSANGFQAIKFTLKAVMVGLLRINGRIKPYR
jgi:hypothetical protein